MNKTVDAPGFPIKPEDNLKGKQMKSKKMKKASGKKWLARGMDEPFWESTQSIFVLSGLGYPKFFNPNPNPKPGDPFVIDYDREIIMGEKAIREKREKEAAKTVTL